MRASNFQETVEASKASKPFSLDSSPNTFCGDVAAPAVLLRTTKQRGWNYFMAMMRSIRLATSVR